MKILTNPITKQLRANSVRNQISEDMNMMPVVKLFGGGACTWLLSELDDNGIAFGLCDLGFGTPELGYVSMEELEAIRFPPFGLPIERDRHWEPSQTLAQYADDARLNGRIAA